MRRLDWWLRTGCPGDVRRMVRMYSAAGLIGPVDVDQLDDNAVRQIALNTVKEGS